MLKVPAIVKQWFSRVAPRLLTVMIFAGGGVLLLSGSLPSERSRLLWLKDFLPLPLIEASHFLGSMAGIGLIILARGLQRRVDAAYHLTSLLLMAGIAFSLLKGFDYEEAIILSVMLACLVPCRRYFYRKASFANERFTKGWILSIVLLILCSIWLGFFYYRHVEYSHDLWWQFTLFGHAPRFMRASVGVVGLLLFLVLARLIRPAQPDLTLPTAQELSQASEIVRSSRKAYAHYALLGDKAILLSPSRKTFVMYGIQGRSWVALGDPVGDEQEMPDLLWKFREACDRYNGWAVFSEVGTKHLPLYLDIGLALLKIGEEARVPLHDFVLDRPERKELRYIIRRFERDGLTFEVIPQEGTPDILPELKEISDLWLSQKHTREKRFSMGLFDETYLRHFSFGVVRQGKKILAFTNILRGAEREEVTLDLIRYRNEAPNGVMDYLFTQIILWAQKEGYRWCSLGMAPLAGLQNRAMAPLWIRAGALIFRHGEHFYNFQGIREYKEKFHPLWEPKYMASPGGLSVPRVLADIAALNSGGMQGIFLK